MKVPGKTPGRALLFRSNPWPRRKKFPASPGMSGGTRPGVATRHRSGKKPRFFAAATKPMSEEIATGDFFQ
jgi:hypothetical protein